MPADADSRYLRARADMLEIDHLFCFVEPEGDWAARLMRGGFRLDDGIEHAGQGTRNRRLWMPEHYFELLYISDRGDAERNPLRLDRRADWRSTGACPFGIGLRGTLASRDDFWAYHPPYAPEATIWIHQADERQPFLFAFDGTPEQIEPYLPRNRLAATPDLLNDGAIREIRLALPVAGQALLGDVAPRVTWSLGPPHMEIVLEGVDGARPALDVTTLVSIS